VANDLLFILWQCQQVHTAYLTLWAYGRGREVLSLFVAEAAVTLRSPAVTIFPVRVARASRPVAAVELATGRSCASPLSSPSSTAGSALARRQ
jgi:hypothetical protein